MHRIVAMTVLAVLMLVPFWWMSEAWTGPAIHPARHSHGAGSSGAPSQQFSRGDSGRGPFGSPSTGGKGSARRGGQAGGIISGLVLGGLIGSLLLGESWRGGISLFDIMFLAALTYLAFRALHDGRPQPAPAEPPPGRAEELERMVGAVRRVDPSFEPRRFGETVAQIFAKVQSAWAARDMARARDVLTPEMNMLFQRDCDRMEADGVMSRLDAVTLRGARITEAWREHGQCYVTVHMTGSLIDFTSNEAVHFDEFWTLARPAEPDTWRLCAVQHPVTRDNRA